MSVLYYGKFAAPHFQKIEKITSPYVVKKVFVDHLLHST